MKGKNFVYTLQITMEETTDEKAMEKLSLLLNHRAIKDFRITEKVEVKESAAEPKLKPPVQNSNKQISELLHHFQEHGTLIRISVVKGKGIKLNFPCRILNFDPTTENVSVYHVDEKKVYLLKLNEIDDFVVN